MALLMKMLKKSCAFTKKDPNRDDTDSCTFILRLSETGVFKLKSSEGRPRSIRTPELEGAVLQDIEWSQGTSTTKIGRALNITYKMLWSMLRNWFYAYHLQRVQALLPRIFH